MDCFIDVNLKQTILAFSLLMSVLHSEVLCSKQEGPGLVVCVGADAKSLIFVDVSFVKIPATSTQHKRPLNLNKRLILNQDFLLSALLFIHPIWEV